MSESAEPQTQIGELSKSQRRVLGVLVEKGLTTPEYYPLTLKAIATGANQKSNRLPISNYSEDDIIDVLEQLRQIGLAAVVHTESGRTERYRHYVRKVFPYSEPQLAIMAELLLRGNQQLGELRSRASRMVTIENQSQLKEELAGLMEMGHIQANGDLARRGVEVDHAFYTSREQEHHPFGTTAPQQAPVVKSGNAPSFPASPASTEAAAEISISTSTVSEQNADIEQLQKSHAQLSEEVAELRDQIKELSDQLASLKQQLGE